MRAARVVVAISSVVCISCGSPSPDSRVQAKYDKNTGKLRLLSYDSNNNGISDNFSYMDGNRVLRVEIDRDEDGKIERWEYYTADNKLEKVGLSTAHDGKVDQWMYQNPDGAVARIETSTKRDGKVTRTEFYENGKRVRIEDDTDGDGLIDKWETYSDDLLTSVAFDPEHTGRPTRRLMYGKDGAVTRVESGASASDNIPR